MAISSTAKQYIEEMHLDYTVHSHAMSHCSQETAELMHISGEKLVKSIVMEDEKGYVLAVIPATHRLDENAIRTLTHRNLQIAPEVELADLFYDCQLGAIPPVGQAYGIETIVDTTLYEQQEVFFEGGDHLNVIHMHKDEFLKLMDNAVSATISMHR